MTKEVLIRIRGLQMTEEDQDNVEVILPGDYFFKNGKHYIVYDEVIDGFEGMIRNTMKITPDKMEIRKHGLTEANMVFERDKKNLTRYITPLGEMIIEVATDRIDMEEEEDRLQVSVHYSLDINYDHVSDCDIVVDVSSKEKAQLQLS